MVQKSFPSIYNYLGLARFEVLAEFASQVFQSFQLCYFLANSQLDFTSQPMMKSIYEDVLPHHHISLVIYNFKYQCDSEYIGRTNQRLVVTIQHMSAKIHSRQYDNLQTLVNTSGSATAEHLIGNQICASAFARNSFSVISRAYIQTSI